MKKLLVLCAFAFLLATPSLAQKVNIDYARDYEWGNTKTFQYISTNESNVQGNDLMANRIEGMIRQKLRDGGLQEVQSDPDLYVTYHYTSEDRTSYNTTGFGYGGYWGGWGGWGYPMGGISTSTTTEYNYTEGTLIIDAYEPSEKKMVWRGSGTVTVKAKPEKQIKQVENILSKLGSRWQKILAGQGK